MRERSALAVFVRSCSDETPRSLTFLGRRQVKVSVQMRLTPREIDSYKSTASTMRCAANWDRMRRPNVPRHLALVVAGNHQLELPEQSRISRRHSCSRRRL